MERKPVTWTNVGLGAGIQLFIVSTLGQPLDVIKTHLATKRQDSIRNALTYIYKERGGWRGFYQGLIPWGCFEAVTKGAVLMLVASEIEYHGKKNGIDQGTAGIIAGVGGGLSQAYLTMGFTTLMKTVEATRCKQQKVSTLRVAFNIFKEKGILGLNKGVSAVAIRQMSTWGSRIGITRAVEYVMKPKGRDLSVSERMSAATLSGILSCWNHPIEVIRIEMQNAMKNPSRPQQMTLRSTAKYVFQTSGLFGFYRGVLPRIGISVYMTLCVVVLGDELKKRFNSV